MKLKEYTELLRGFLKHYPDSCLALSIKDGSIKDVFTPAVDGNGDVLVNYLTDKEDFQALPDTLFEIFPICGCGCPECALLQYRNALRWCEKDILERNYNGWTENEGLNYVVLYVLNDKGLTEHGTSINGSFLTEKGQIALAILNNINLGDDNE